MSEAAVAEPCDRRNPLIRAGLTQAGRNLAERARDHFLPDERDLADLVLFGQRFAWHLNYYDEANVKRGDWRVFFESDLTSALAALAKLPIEAFRTFQIDLEHWLRADPTRDPGELGDHFKLWFHLPVVLLEITARHHGRLPNDHPLATGLPRLIARDLAEPLTRLIGWYKGALTDGGGPGADLFADTALAQPLFNLAGGGDPRIRLSSTVAGEIFGRPPLSAVEVGSGLLSLIPPGDWAGLYAATPADAAPYQDAGDPYPRIYDALTYNLLTRAAERFHQGFLRLRQDAAAALEASLTEFGAHPAHYGLWLAFLKLFRHAQTSLNGFTGRHMDHYLREVLQLRPRAPQPDHAHLTFGLAKGIERHFLAKGTAFRAGKDALGRPVSFTLDGDIVVNRGAVAMLSGIHLDEGKLNGAPTLLPRASSVVASLDGLGEEDLAEGTAFPVFGPAEAPFARIGFAVADRRLFLREGIRQIVLRAELTRPIDESLHPRFRVRLTGEEDWFEPDSVTVKIDNAFPEEVEENEVPTRGEAGFGIRRNRGATKETVVKAERAFGSATGAFNMALRMRRDSASVTKAPAGPRAGRPGRTKAPPHRAPPKLPPSRGETRPKVVRHIHMLQITLDLGALAPAVVPLDPELHGGEHDPGLPVAEVILDFDAPESRRAFAALRNSKVTRLSVWASASGLKQLTIIAGGAEADPAKPFTPWGPRPKKNDTLILGSSEIFSKPIDNWSLSLDWKEPYSIDSHFLRLAPSSIRPREWLLTGGDWLRVGGDKRRAAGVDMRVGGTGVTATLASGPDIDGRVLQTLENPPLEVTSTEGFLRLALDETFGHDAWPTEQARAMVTLAQDNIYAGNTSLYNYEGADSSGKGKVPRQPYAPEITRIEAAYETRRSAAESLCLLAPFGTEPDAGRLFPALPFAGALYLGIEGLDPPEKLTLLIEVEDGSGDPLLPVPNLDFAYLDGDGFTGFPDQDVDDKTLNLTTSGILGLAMPKVAGTDHRVLPQGLTWIRIAAPDYPDALNRIASINAQAARATFADQGNDPARLAAPLPAGTIAKLATPEPPLKTVTQPYPGFGGRPPETPEAMDTRVAERLRHKDRAIAPWDYEAIVLDAFPQLYRVKCLPLTELARDEAGVIRADNEVSPGAVALVTVPSITTGARDPLRPYSDRATLTAVNNHLKARISPFVRLEVVNPKLEEVHLDFRVRFKPGIADIAFYSDRLNEALVGYLTPWAAGGGEITFGGRLWRSRVIDFLDERPEVDFVTEVKMFHKIDITAPEGGWTPIPLEVIEATSARSILVSARRHVIREVPHGG
jgi:hypothetical protein